MISLEVTINFESNSFLIVTVTAKIVLRAIVDRSGGCWVPLGENIHIHTPLACYMCTVHTQCRGRGHLIVLAMVLTVDECKQLLAEGYNFRRIGERHNMSRAAVRQFAFRHKIKAFTEDVDIEE